MPSWGNTDAATAKPKWNAERQAREVIVLTTANSTAVSANTIKFTYYDGYQNNLANVGVAVGQSVIAANLAGNGVSNYFTSNNQVASINGNVVAFNVNTFGTIAAGASIEFDAVIPYLAAKGVTKTYNLDTVMVTATRTTSANNNIGGNLTPGWMHVQKKVNNDGTVRYIRETLIAMASPTASNTQSGNTSWGTAVSNT
jgi:uncharacterized membrane protein (DUF441 family)